MKLIQKFSPLVLLFASFAQAHDAVGFISNQSWIALQQSENQALGLNWKVGDSLSYQVSLGSMGRLGTSVKEVTQDTGDTLWIKNQVRLFGQNEIVEMEFRKADGQVVRMRRNGQDQSLPNDTVEIISTEAASITVPAGTFESVHIVAKTEQVERIEVWMNPRDTAIEGTLKQAASTQVGQMILELTSFKKN